MARKKFDMASDLFADFPSNAKNAQEVQEVCTRSTRSGTQGRKGCHAKRINMAFSDDNYEWIRKTARQEGITMTQLVNAILDSYRK